MRRSRVLALAAAFVASLALAAPASAQIELESFTSVMLGPDATQAGAHPDSQVTFMVPRDPGVVQPLEVPRNVMVDMPVGLAGNAVATPLCTHAQLLLWQCPASSQVGYAYVATSPNPDWDNPTNAQAVYALVPEKGQVAQFGFNFGSTANILINIDVRSDSDYGLRATIRTPPTELLPGVYGTRLTLWGVPADPKNDARRVGPLNRKGVASGAPAVPLLTNPTTCDGSPPTTTIRLDSWQSPGQYTTATTTSDPITGCDRLPFEPSLRLQPQERRAGVPSAYDVTLRVPQNEAPYGIGTAFLRDVTVTLPEGVAISPSEADGLLGCTNEQAGFGTTGPAGCPDASKIGTAEIDTPLLGETMRGWIHLGQPLPGNMFRIFLLVEGSGVVVKLEGRVDRDASTGQITTVFTGQPQLPFDELRLRFQGGPRAPLSNPPTCGEKTTSWSMTSWAGQTVGGSDSFAITADANGNPCPASQPFDPRLTAGTIDPQGGAFSPFTLTFARQDTDQALGGIAVDMPRGLLGKVSSVPLCPEGLATAGACGAGSQIGTVTTAAGPGTTPFHLPGRVYLTDGYKGGQFGLSIVVPAIAGPFDLGTVVVRASIHVDPSTAALRVVSDPLPTILHGVPLQIRSVALTLDRPGFMFNPTNCLPSSIDASIASAAGASASRSARFQAASCASLPYTPRLLVTVGDRGRTRQNGRTPLTAVLTQRGDQANSRIVELTLPSAIAANLRALERRCAMDDFLATSCADPLRIGDASAVTPLLRDPLRGGVYFVNDPRRPRGLPLIAVALRGQVAFNLFGRVTLPRNGKLIRTTFDAVPDVPIRRFRLTLVGRGGNAPLSVVARGGLCGRVARRALAAIAFRAQSNRRTDVDQRLRIRGCPVARKAGKGAARARGR